MALIRLAETLLAALGAGAVRFLPEACALCASSSRDNKAAYIGTTLLLLGLPLALLGGFALWIIRRAR